MSDWLDDTSSVYRVTALLAGVFTLLAGAERLTCLAEYGPGGAQSWMVARTRVRALDVPRALADRVYGRRGVAFLLALQIGGAAGLMLWFDSPLISRVAAACWLIGTLALNARSTYPVEGAEWHPWSRR